VLLFGPNLYGRRAAPASEIAPLIASEISQFSQQRYPLGLAGNYHKWPSLSS
jgi:hypothetical protein